MTRPPLSRLRAVAAQARKALVATAGLVGQLLALGLLHGTAEQAAQVVLAAATALGVYGVRNASKSAL